MKLHFLLLLCLSVQITLSAQWTPYRQSKLDAYNEGKNTMVVLKDSLNLLPLQRLDTLRIAYLPIGILPEHPFHQQLLKYTKVEVLPTFSPNMDWWQAYRQGYDLYIFGVYGKNLHQHTPHYQRLAPVIEEVIGKHKTLVYVTDGVDVFKELPIIEQADAVIINGRGGGIATTSATVKLGENPYPLPPVRAENGTLLPNFRNKQGNAIDSLGRSQPFVAEDLGAQLIFGALGTDQRLAEDLSTRFPKGSGTDKQGGIRLGYAPPEAVGMDGILLADSVRAILEEGIEAGAFPGAQVLVAKNGQVVYHQVFGYHTYENDHAVKTSDIYDFASVTKTTSALLGLMQLRDQGKFQLDDPLEKYFPDFKRGNKGALPFREMLAHQARLRPWIPYWQGTLKGHGRYPWKKRWDGTRTNDYRFRCSTFKRDSTDKYNVYITDDLWLHRDYKKRIYKAIRKSPLNEKAEYVYSGLLFYLLPEMVANLTGRDYETYLKEAFYHRLGAYTLTYNPLRFYPKDRIVPTERDTFFRMVQIHGYVHDEGAAMMGGVSANAGLFGSANDLAKLAQMYLNYGTYGGERLIEEETVREFARCQYCELGNRRGLGFDKPLIEYDAKASSVAEAASPESFGHSGYTGTFYWVDPETELIYIFFSNRVFPTRNNRKIYTHNIRPRVHSALYQAIKVVQ